MTEAAPFVEAWLVIATRDGKVNRSTFVLKEDADQDAWEWRINGATTEIKPLTLLLSGATGAPSESRDTNDSLDGRAAPQEAPAGAVQETAKAPAGAAPSAQSADESPMTVQGLHFKFHPSAPSAARLRLPIRMECPAHEAPEFYDADGNHVTYEEIIAAVNGTPSSEQAPPEYEPYIKDGKIVGYTFKNSNAVKVGARSEAARLPEIPDGEIRARFEAWASRMNLNTKRVRDGNYRTPYTQWTWEAFYCATRLQEQAAPVSATEGKKS